MISLCLTFVVHNPFVLKKNYNYFCIGRDFDYFDLEHTQQRLDAFSENCYIPANHTLLQAIQQYSNKFKVSFAVSNILIQQLEQFRPDVLESFEKLFATGNVEVLAGTGTHSLASLYSEKEFNFQVKKHHSILSNLFKMNPKVFLNTEMIYSNKISELISQLNYTGILTEGTEHVLGWRSPNFVYQPKTQFKSKLLFRNSSFSNALAFKFSDPHWNEYPFTTEKFVDWIIKQSDKDQVVNIVLDYETFGYYQALHTGILAFLATLPSQVLSSNKIQFSTPSEVIKRSHPIAKIDVPFPISWAGVEQDISAWTGNDLQLSALEAIYSLENKIKKKKDEYLLEIWRNLQTADYFQYMDTRWTNKGYQPHSINNFESVEEAYIVYNNILNDLSLRIAN